MSLGIKQGGVWKTPIGFSVKQGGVWKPVLAGFVRQGGTWKQFWSTVISVVLFPDPQDRGIEVVTGAKVFISASLNIGTTGLISSNYDINYFGGPWAAPQSAGLGNGYFVRFSKRGTGNFSGSSLNTWFPLTSQRTITVATTSNVANASGFITLELSTDGVNPIASASVSYVLTHDIF